LEDVKGPAWSQFLLQLIQIFQPVVFRIQLGCLTEPALDKAEATMDTFHSTGATPPPASLVHVILGFPGNLPVAPVVFHGLEEVSGDGLGIPVDGSHFGSSDTELPAPGIHLDPEFPRGLVHKLPLGGHGVIGKEGVGFKVHALTDVEGNHQEKVKVNMPGMTSFVNPDVFGTLLPEFPQEFLKTKHCFTAADSQTERGRDEHDVPCRMEHEETLKRQFQLMPGTMGIADGLGLGKVLSDDPGGGGGGNVHYM